MRKELELNLTVLKEVCRVAGTYPRKEREEFCKKATFEVEMVCPPEPVEEVSNVGEKAEKVKKILNGFDSAVEENQKKTNKLEDDANNADPIGL